MRMKLKKTGVLSALSKLIFLFLWGWGHSGWYIRCRSCTEALNGISMLAGLQHAPREERC